MDNTQQKKIAFFIIILTFFHGVFSTGFMPILNKELGIESSLPFALYFLGILIGQFLIYKFARLSYTLKLFSLYEIFFGIPLIFMAIFNTKFGFSTGRFIEGFFGGLSTPLLFGLIINLKSLGTESKRLAGFNSLNALGFVLGPVVISQLINYFDYKICLIAFSLLFIIISLIFSVYKTPELETQTNENLKIKDMFNDTNGFEKFYTFFITKSFYGFLLTSVPSFLLLYITEKTSISSVIVISAIIFVFGQIVIENLIKKFPREHLEIFIPVLLAISLTLFVYTKSINFIYISSFLHSMLAFLAYLNFSFKSNSIREFALFNLLSDPGMVMGAFLANLGIIGIWPIIFLMTIPLFKSIFKSEQQTRAEKFIPFIGVITLFKILKKHRNPKLEPEENIKYLLTDKITFKPVTNKFVEKANNTVSLLFTGDFCPSEYTYQFNNDVKEFITKHDLRILNLEGLQTSDSQKKFGFNISDSQFKNIIYPNDKPLFNLLSFVNNHVMDLGSNIYLENTEKLKQNSMFKTFNSELTVIDIKSMKIGFFALTFASNFFWRKNDLVSTIKPDDIVNNQAKKAEITSLIRNYKSQVDILVLSYHWGYESEYLPSETQRKCFDILNAAGIDILYGHHSHIVQPFEINESIADSLCLYSCGNFISDPHMSEKIYNQGVFYSVEISLKNKTLKIEHVEPYFIETIKKDDSIKEICFISPTESLSYNNWLKYSNI